MGQRHHHQTTPYTVQNIRHGLQRIRIKIRANIIGDGILGVLQTGTGLLDHRGTRLTDLFRRHKLGIILLIITGSGGAGVHGHTLQGGFHIQQCTGHIHQHVVVERAAVIHDAANGINLFDDNTAWITHAQYRQGIGDLFQHRNHAAQLRAIHRLPAHE